LISQKKIDELLPAFRDPRVYIPTFLHIRDVESQVIPFRLNHVQNQILSQKRAALERRPRQAPRNLVLKARRMGVTTLEQGLNFYWTSARKNREVVTLAHDIPHTEKIFRIANLFYEKNQPGMKPRRLAPHSKRDLNFARTNSLFSIATAGSRAPSRSQTLDRVHWSEVAFSPGDLEAQRGLLAGLTEAASHGSVTLESTANGVGNLFHQLCDDARKGQGPWNLILIPWFHDPSYVMALTRDQRETLMKNYTEEEKDLVAKHGLTPEQIAWRRQKHVDMYVGGDSVLFPQEYLEDFETAFLTLGQGYFDVDIIKKLISEGAAGPIEVRKIPGHRANTGGELVIYARPVPGRNYVIGADPAGGSPVGHESVAAVLDCETCEQVAVLRGRWKPEVFGELIAQIGKHYNDAMVGVEQNNHGHSVLNTLINTVDYPELYCHGNYATGKKSDEPGWRTDGRTRPLMLGDLRKAIQNREMPVRDMVLLQECLSFKLSRDEEKYMAAEGCLDDSIFAWAIAWQVRKDPEAMDEGIPDFSVDKLIESGHRIFSRDVHPGRMF